MKHDHRGRRRDRRGTSPSVICLPSQMPPYTPPREEPAASDAPPLADDAERLARKNIYEVQPRMSRQARRKAARAEKKAARRAATELFLAGAPSLHEAAARMMPERPAEAAILSTGTSMVAMAELLETPVHIAIDEMDEGDVLVAERPATLACAAEEPEEAEIRTIEAATEEADVSEMDMSEADEEIVPLEEIAQIISATGPLIVSSLDDETGQIAEIIAVAPDPAAAAPMIAAPEPEPLPVLEQTKAELTPTAQDAEPDPPSVIAIEKMTAPLPRDRALVPAKRHWLLRLVPWLGPRRKVRAPEPAMAQLQELRFELVTALRRLDQILDQTA